MKPVLIKSFSETYDDVLALESNPDVNEYYLNAVKKMSEEEKEYSFLNTMFVFQKGGDAKKIEIKEKEKEEEVIPKPKPKKLVIKKKNT